MISPYDIGLPAKFSSFRTYPGFSQWETAAKLASSDHRFLGVCAPPGVGKSIINFTASRLIDAPRTLYLTPKKSLQTQLMNDFADSEIGLFSLTGHSSYPCTNKLYSSSGDLEDMECSEGRSGNCPYWQDVDISLLKSNIVSNPANWVSIARAGDPERFGKFDLLILDEAHNLESLLCDLLSIKISRRTIGELLGVRVPTDNLIPSWIEWATECLPLTSTALAESRRVDKLSNSRESITTKRLKRLLEYLSTISQITDTWVCEPIDSGLSVKLTPVFASNYAEKYLFRGIERIILSSATLTREDFTYLGIDELSFDLIDIESGFAVNRRPFYYWPTCPIQHDMAEGQWRQVMNRIDKFIDPRLDLDRKGIIQSVSYPYAERLAATSRHKIITHKSRNSQSVIDEFMSNKSPGILASPIIYEGFDFADDKARFNIFLKVPTPPDSLLIQARKKRDKKYKLYLAAKTILQSYGRVVRSSGDWGEGLMLDKNWGDWMLGAVSWPRYFRRAWKEVRDVPVPINF